jgi:putative hydroxymethylpyrimidine transport system substrate-binding protein
MNSWYRLASPWAARLAFSAAGIAILLGGCGGAGTAATGPAEDPEYVFATLDGNISAANIGLRIAQKRGYFEDGGLEISATDPSQPGQAVAFVSAGDDEFGIVHEPQAVMAAARNSPIVVVGGVISEPTTALIWLKRSKIRGIRDLEGKSIAVPGIPYQREFLKLILAHAGLTLEDVKVRSIQYRLLRALRSGRVDAIFGASWNHEGVALKAQGEEPVVRRVQEFGIPDYEELVVVANADRAREDPESVRAFMSALSRGIAVAEQNPKATAKLIFEDSEHNPLIGPKAIGAGVEATLPLLTEDQVLDLGKAKSLIAWMYKEGMIEHKPSVKGFFTNEFLAQP